MGGDDGGNFAFDAGVYDDDGGVPTWAEVAGELFGAGSAIDSSFRLDFVPTNYSGQWAGGILTRSGSVLCMPYQADAMLEISPSRKVTTRPVSGPVPQGGWEGAVLLADGTVLGLPYHAGSFLLVPPDGGTARLVDAGLEGRLVSPYFEGGVVTRSGKVLLAPYGGGHPAVFDPATEVLTVLDAGVTGVGPGEMYSGAVLLPDGESALLVPRSGTELLKVTPTGIGARHSLDGLSGGVILPSGDVVMVPGASSQFARWSAVGNPVHFGPASTAYISAAWSTNGFAYAVQTFRVAGNVAVIQSDGQVSEVASPRTEISSDSHYGFVAMNDGTIVGCPFFSPKVLFLTPTVRRVVSLRTMTSPWFNKW
jgi:hypothetical protein